VAELQVVVSDLAASSAFLPTSFAQQATFLAHRSLIYYYSSQLPESLARLFSKVLISIRPPIQHILGWPVPGFSRLL